MKRDYLKNLDIGGGAHLSDELIEQLMAEALKKQLVAYQRAENIQSQESRRITLKLDPRCLMYWDNPCADLRIHLGNQRKMAAGAGKKTGAAWLSVCARSDSGKEICKNYNRRKNRKALLIFWNILIQLYTEI